MSLYREARSRSGRWLAAVGAALAVGLGAGVAVGIAVTPDPSLADGVERVQDDVRPALDALELVPIHFESSEAVTRRAAADQLARAREAFASAEPDLRLLDPAGTAVVARDLETLERLVAGGGEATEVDALAQRAARRLRAVARLARD